MANPFFIELADTGLGNFSNNGDLARNGPLVDVPFLDKRLEMFLKRPGIDRPVVTHHQQRERALPDWPYNLFCSVSAESSQALQARIDALQSLPLLAAFGSDVLHLQPSAG